MLLNTEINRDVGVCARKQELTSKDQFCDIRTVFIIIMSDAEFGILARSLYEMIGQHKSRTK
jgi:hypothetical protein